MKIDILSNSLHWIEANMIEINSNQKKIILVGLSLSFTVIFYLVFTFLIQISQSETSGEYAYNNWISVVFNVLFFSLIGVGFIIPMKKREWRTLGLYQAFIVALFTEMYGFPLTIFLLSSVFGFQLSFGHIQGHLLAVLLASLLHINIEITWSAVMIVSSGAIAIGVLLIYSGWSLIHASPTRLVTYGIYSYVRHPQYLGFIILIIGFLIQWPTIFSLLIGPILIFSYYLLAKKEEKENLGVYGNEYKNYTDSTPMIIPFVRRKKNYGGNITNFQPLK